ncbi:MAG TPA: glycine zipper 2TM domain-containing protein [Usitatibacter sp.]|nr:glycine zipper 2TM domain-containing protein [Usitatibacter sp.]
MKSIAIAVASLFTVIAPAANAAYDRNGNYYEPDAREYRSSDFRDREARPAYAAESREECWNTRNGRFESRPESSNRVGAGTAVGAVAGGVLGHQVGSGRGNDAATVGGALIGGLIGHQVEKDKREDRSTEGFDMSRCRTVATNESYDSRWR